MSQDWKLLKRIQHLEKKVEKKVVIAVYGIKKMSACFDKFEIL